MCEFLNSGSAFSKRTVERLPASAWDIRGGGLRIEKLSWAYRDTNSTEMVLGFRVLAVRSRRTYRESTRSPEPETHEPPTHPQAR